MLRKLSLLVALSLATSTTLAPAAGAVDGVLSFDSAAVRPIYLKAFDLQAGARITGAELYLNDRTALPTMVSVVPGDAEGSPDWERAVSTGVSLLAVEGEVLQLALGMGPLAEAGRVWLAVEFSCGDDAPEEGLRGGPAVGYYVTASRLGDQLLSPDGGTSYDRLSSELSLAMELVVESDGVSVGPSSSMLAGSRGSSKALSLHAAPNPFNPRTELFFELPVAGEVKLVLYDVRGRRVRTLIQEHRRAGVQSIVWDGRDEQGGPVASGTLYARLSGPEVLQTTRLVLLQ